MTRLRTAFDSIRQTWPVTSIPSDPLIDAMQSGDRLTYHPERIVEEIAHLHEVLPAAAKAVRELSDDFVQQDKDITLKTANLLGTEFSETLRSNRQIRLDALARARLMIEEAAR
jgi:alpha-glucosidase